MRAYIIFMKQFLGLGNDIFIRLANSQQVFKENTQFIYSAPKMFHI